MRAHRPFPRRSASRYPAGTVLRLRDGRSFRVVETTLLVWDDPTEGNGGGFWEQVRCLEWEPISHRV